MKLAILTTVFMLSILHIYSVKSVRADSSSYTCPLSVSDINGVMQWNDGWPFSAYGRQSHFNDNYQVVDINAYYGSYVKAPVSGTVIDVYDDPPSDVSYGTNVVIRGDDGSISELSHIFDPVGVGSRVSLGQAIGYLITFAQAQTDHKVCNLTLADTTRECYKAHLHFSMYNGRYERNIEPLSMGVTLSFLSSQCNLKRITEDINPEFPQLPTLNCAKITGNPNINRCFMEKPSAIMFKGGWNKLLGSSLINRSPTQLPNNCLIVQKNNYFNSYVWSIIQIPWKFIPEAIYYISCRQQSIW